MRSSRSKESVSRVWLFLLFVTLSAILLLSIASGNLSASNNLNDNALLNSQSSGPIIKVIAPAGVLDTSNAGISLWHDYGSFALYRVTESTLDTLPADVQARLVIDSSMDRLMFDEATIDTKLAAQSGEASTAAVGSEETLQLIQFVGPIKQEWLQEVESTGAKLVQYVAENGYLVWANGNSRNQLNGMAAAQNIMQFSQPLPSSLKVGPSLDERLNSNGTNAADTVRIVVQMVRHNRQGISEQAIRALAVSQDTNWTPVLAFQNAHFTVRLDDIETISNLPDVYWVEEWLERELLDEVQGQILAGNFNGSQSGPSGPGYLAWLSGYGFSTNPADYPVVDITDDGIGTGSVNSGDPTLHEFGSTANPTRLSYVANCTSASNGGGPDGHGHINVNIAGGYDTRSGFPFRDPLGFQRGLGINPYGRFAGTRIFAPSFNLSNCGGTDTGLIKSSQDNGAQISSNSWGCSSCAGTYDTSSQAYDVGTRDADLTQAGNQEMIFIFAAGNSGPGSATVGSPGNGKNMITVGASENNRPSDEDGSWTDGCAISASGANNAMDVISFSSRGPSPGGRVKPEVIAPGTHIQGTASTHPSYNGSGVCDQYRPSGQTTFAASSGTSHSTPAVAGVSSLAYYWLENTYGVSTPSSAVMKAYLIAHPTYLTGVSANDTLPSNSQGYGMPNMSLMFDDAEKFVLDQTVIFNNSGETWTWQGVAADPSRPVRIVLAYTDAAGAVGTSPQVNNLNLAANVGGTNYLGNRFSGQWSTTGGSPDALNNYEAIFLPAGTSGAINITVTGFNIAGNGIPNSGDNTDQDFALVCYNCTENVGPTPTPGPTSTATNTPPPTNTPVPGSCTVYNSTDVPKSISSSGTPSVSSVLNISGSGTIDDINVLNLNGTHTWINDLDFNLSSPGGTSVQIMARSCSSEDNFNLNLDDEAAPGSWPCPPVGGGTYQPSNPLSAFDGQSANGTWTLIINDNANLDGGSLNGWSLEVCTVGAVPTATATATSSPPPTATNTPIPTATATATASPTPPPTSTNTPVPTATNTPVPTATNTPAPPTPTPTTPPSGTIFFDNFETNQGWIVNPNGTDTATTGMWQRADPEQTSSNGVKQLGTTVSGSNDLVTGALAGSSVGANDVDNGVTSIRSPNISLPSGQNITLSFSYYLAHTSNSSSADFLRVTAVGSSSQLLFEELGAANNDNGVWETATVNLNAFAGQTIYLRIEAADNANGSIVEAGIDDVKIVAGAAPVCTTYTSTNVPISLPNGTSSISSQLTVGPAVTIGDLDVTVNMAHTWVGDLSMVLTHQNTGTAVTIIDRPGVPASTYGCSGDNIAATLSDEAALPVENQCAGSTPTINGTFSPNNALTAFDGESSSGTWQLTVTDSYTSADAGTLNAWSITVCTP